MNQKLAKEGTQLEACGPSMVAIDTHVDLALHHCPSRLRVTIDSSTSPLWPRSTMVITPQLPAQYKNTKCYPLAVRLLTVTKYCALYVICHALCTSVHSTLWLWSFREKICAEGRTVQRCTGQRQGAG